MHCKYCGQELPAGAHGKRAYCDDAHRQAYFRKTHRQDQGHTLTHLRSELETLRAKVRDQAQTIDDQACEISRLRERLDIERRFLADQEPGGFRAWLKKRPSTSLVEKLLADPLFKPRDTRKHYEYYLRHHFHCTEDEMQEFVELWKLMLLTRP